MRVEELIKDEDLSDDSIFIKDSMVYFYDRDFMQIPESYDGTWIKALVMRWRYVK